MTVVKKLEIGTSVSHFHNRGAVVAIHGEQDPTSVRRLCGVMAMGGNAEVDIVFVDGSKANKVPESILYGPQWTVNWDVIPLSQEKVAELQMNAVIVKAQIDAKESARKEWFAARKSLLEKRFSGLFMLEQDRPKNWSSDRVVTHNIRAYLKRRFKGIKFSVRTDHHSSINIRWTDGPSERMVKQFTGRFSSGYFDGMVDSYEYVRTPWNSIFGGCRFISVRREVSPEQCKLNIKHVLEEEWHNTSQFGVVTPEMVEQSWNYEHLNCFDSFVHDLNAYETRVHANDYLEQRKASRETVKVKKSSSRKTSAVSAANTELSAAVEPSNVIVPAKGVLYIVDFSERAIIVRGETKKYKDVIKAVPGASSLWNDKANGWVFSKKKESVVRNHLKDFL